MTLSGTDPARQLENLLQQARIHHTPCDHGELAWQEWSGPEDAPPLVLVHGGFGSWTHWAANLPGLMQRRKVWTLDLPGLGDSADMPEPHTAAHAARIVLHGLDQLLGPTAHFELAGFSFGAMVAARLAESAASRCERFVAIGAAGCGDLHVQVHLQLPPIASMPAAEARSIHHANLRVLMLAEEDSIDDLAVYIHGENLLRHRINTRRLSLTDDFLQALPHIKARLVGVWGSRDATAGHRDAIDKRRELFRQAQPEAEFHVLRGVGHWAMYEDPESVNRILLGD